MRRLAACSLALLAVWMLACASAGAPPGGPEDHAPPQILAISPDSGELNVKVRSVQFSFDEVVNDRPSGAAGGLDGIFLISPMDGAAQVSWRRDKITVRPRKGFRPNTAYRVTLLPGLADLRGNVRRETKTIVFSTGPSFPPFSVRGIVFDWTSQRPANGAFVEAVSRRDSTLIYVTATDTAGIFDLGPLAADTFVVRAIIDQNVNRKIDRGEKWDSLTVPITTASRSIELEAIERDSVPPSLDAFMMIDSVTLRVTFDKPIDPTMQLTPNNFTLQRGDSSRVEIRTVQWQSAYERARAVSDSTHRADSLRAKARADSAAADSARARGDTAAARRLRPAAPAPPPPAARQAPPPPKPRNPPPDRGVVLTLNPASPIHHSSAYRLTARGIRNLVGHADTAVSRNFETPKPPPPPDTTAKAPRDTVRRPPATRPPPTLR